jgi:CRISPR/Cas system-associated protein Csx1
MVMDAIDFHSLMFLGGSNKPYDIVNCLGNDLSYDAVARYLEEHGPEFAALVTIDKPG